MEIKMVLYLPRDAVSVPVSRQVLDSCLETLGVTEETRGDIALALSEACANVIQHAGEGDEYEVLVSAKDCQCVIEVVNATSPDGDSVPGSAPLDGFALVGDRVPATAEHGRGLQIIDAVADNVQLTASKGRGTTTVHFEKKLEWVPGAPGPHLFHDDGAC
jgi:serine/threonine-protein kinase RsbW